MKVLVIKSQKKERWKLKKKDGTPKNIPLGQLKIAAYFWLGFENRRKIPFPSIKGDWDELRRNWRIFAGKEKLYVTLSPTGNELCRRLCEISRLEVIKRNEQVNKIVFKIELQ